MPFRPLQNKFNALQINEQNVFFFSNSNTESVRVTAKMSPFLFLGIQHLGESYESLDASLPWLCYWILHSLELLETPLPEHLSSSIAQFIGMLLELTCACDRGNPITDNNKRLVGQSQVVHETFNSS